MLHFDYDVVLDGRQFERPVNYALVHIQPPDGVIVDAAKRPYLIIDPRAGHGPGIGGFKDDSQVGVALRAGHPVYFVVFFQEPEPVRRCSTCVRRNRRSCGKCGRCIRTASSRPSSATARAAGPR